MERLLRLVDSFLSLFDGPWSDQEASDLDKLTAKQEQTNPNYDSNSRLASCSQSLALGLISHEDAMRVFGAEIVDAARRKHPNLF